MRRYPRQTWLFSFVDIAFLLLLVYTQLARMGSTDELAAEMRLPLPEVISNPELVARKAGNEYRQVLVDKHSAKPYRITHIAGGREIGRSTPLDAAELDAALQAIHGEGRWSRPVIVPLPESFSSDLLQAAALVGKKWHGEGNAVVRTRSGNPP